MEISVRFSLALRHGIWYPYVGTYANTANIREGMK